MSKLVVIRRCATIEEAFVVDSLLQDGGFLSSTPVRYHAQNEWWSVHAFNGIPVFIPAAQVLDAAEYLIEMRKTAKERLEAEFGEIDPTPWKRRPIRRWSMLAKDSGIIQLSLSVLALLLSFLPVGIVPGSSFYQIDWVEFVFGFGIYFLLYCLGVGALMACLIVLTKKTNRSPKVETQIQ